MPSFGGRSTSSDEELARRLQLEEEQLQPSARNADAGLRTRQENDDFAIARQYSQMYLDHCSYGGVGQQQKQRQQQQQQRPTQQNSYDNDNSYGRSMKPNHHTYNNNTQESNSRSRISETNGHDNNHYNSNMNQSNHMSASNHQHSQGYRRSSNQQTYRDPFDYTSSNGNGGGGGMPAPEQYPDYKSPRKEVAVRQTSSDNRSSSSVHAQQYNSTTSTVEVDRDLELARRMQDLEDRGLGQRNSDRRIDDMNHEDLETTTRSSVSEDRNTEYESMARLLSESGADMNEIPDELLCELLGSPSGRGRPSGSSSTLQANRESSISRPTAETRNGLTPKKTGSTRSSPSTAVILKDFDHTNTSEIIIPTDANHPSKNNNKGKRRGIFGFALADKNKFNLDEITMDAPTTTLLPVVSPPPPQVAAAVVAAPPPLPPPPANLVVLEQSIDRKVRPSNTSWAGTIPGAIPDAIPSPGGGSSRQTRSMSPTPRPSGPNISLTTREGSLRNPVAGVPPSTIPPSIPSGIPSAIPPKPAGMMSINQSFSGLYRGTNICAACGLSHGTFLRVLDRKYHPECFRCTSCNGRIDPNDQFKYTTDEKGRVHPHHRECFLTFGVQCCVCQQKVPVTPDGRVPFIKHPFFSTEVMCVQHADEDIRRCCGCQRLEPYGKPYIDLMDEDRCVCPSCCQSVVVDSSEAKPLWNSVLLFIEQKLELPIWGPLRDIPILMVGVESLMEQMSAQGSFYGAMSHNIIAAGLCVTEEGRHDSYTSSYGASTPRTTNVVAILCPTGLPRALVAAILAHESVHAWIQLHPDYFTGRPLSSKVVGGLCQLVAALYLSDAVLPNSKDGSNAIDAVSEKKLRQYYKFCIERDQSDMYGTGYRQAAVAYREIGMERLLSHVLEYRDFPHTDDNDGITLS